MGHKYTRGTRLLGQVLFSPPLFALATPKPGQTPPRLLSTIAEAGQWFCSPQLLPNLRWALARPAVPCGRETEGGKEPGAGAGRAGAQATLGMCWTRSGKSQVPEQSHNGHCVLIFTGCS